MRTFNSYEDAIISSAGMNLEETKQKGRYIDNKSGAYVKRNKCDNIKIYYYGEDVTKCVYTNLLSGAYLPNNLNIGFSIEKNNIIESVGLSAVDGRLPITIYNKEFLYDGRKPLYWINVEGGKYVITDWINNKHNKIWVHYVPVDKLVDIICDKIAKAHDSNSWKEEIGSLLSLIRPILKMCIEDSKRSLELQVEDNLDQIKIKLDDIDSEIEELQKKRLEYVLDYNANLEAQNFLRGNEVKESENQRKK